MTKDEFDALKPGDTIYWTPTGEPEVVLHTEPGKVVCLFHGFGGASITILTDEQRNADTLAEYSLVGCGGLGLPAALECLRKQWLRAVEEGAFHINCLEKLINGNA